MLHENLKNKTKTNKIEEIETEKRNNLQMIYNVVGTGGPLPTRTHLPTPNLLYAAGHIQLSNPKCHHYV